MGPINQSITSPDRGPRLMILGCYYCIKFHKRNSVNVNYVIVTLPGGPPRKLPRISDYGSLVEVISSLISKYLTSYNSGGGPHLIWLPDYGNFLITPSPRGGTRRSFIQIHLMDDVESCPELGWRSLSHFIIDRDDVPEVSPPCCSPGKCFRKIVAYMLDNETRLKRASGLKTFSPVVLEGVSH
ncbi:hypothetical protein BGX38DRAFT_11007 [Terfezia claveryi]|nr:hypothetical protein BGX38DRAFT_11007 [Terfezia claveryi]